MRNMMVNEKGHIGMLDKSFRYLNSGLIHDVYYKDGFIYKCVKPDLIKFNTYSHFEQEMYCHKFLFDLGINVAEIINIICPGEIHNKLYFLVEKYIDGIAYDGDNITDFAIDSVINFITEVSKINVKEYGRIEKNKNTMHMRWGQVLEELGSNARYVSQKTGLSWFMEYLKKGMRLLNDYDKAGSFLIMDPNPSNFIFIKHSNAITAIDIDHPISGDPRYQWACIKWHKPEWVGRSGILRQAIRNEPEILSIYEILYGLNDIFFKLDNGISCKREIEKLKTMHKTCL